MGIVGVALRARNRPVVSGREQLIGARGNAMENFEQDGDVLVHGERWHAVSESALRYNQSIEVTGLDGLTLKVRPVDSPSKEQEDV
jgi:membrane-bound serine protease (ClpP class)